MLLYTSEKKRATGKGEGESPIFLNRRRGWLQSTSDWTRRQKGQTKKGRRIPEKEKQIEGKVCPSITLGGVKVTQAF